MAYYEASRTLLLPGAELDIIGQIGAAACSGKLRELQSDTAAHAQVSALAEKCRGSSNSNLSAYGYLLGIPPRRKSGCRKVSLVGVSSY